MSRRGQLSAVVVLVAALAGCGGQAKATRDHFYRLAVDDVAEARGAAVLDGPLLVKRFGADGLISQRPVVWGPVESPHQLHQYNYHFWADPPPRMVQELTVSVMRSAGVAPVVVTPEMRVTPAYELVGKIRRLEHLRGESSKVWVALELGVYRTADAELVWFDEIDSVQPSADATVAGATAAMNAAMTEIFADALESLASR